MDYGKRRRMLSEALPEKSMAIIYNPQAARQSQCNDYPYRPDSNMMYLCGLDEPGAIAILLSGEQKNRFQLFLMPHDFERERWVGERYGVEGAVSRFGADIGHDIGQYREALSKLLFAQERVYFDFSYASELSPALFEATEKLRHRGRRASEGPRAFCDIRDILAQFRRIKDDDEIAALQCAARVSAAGFQAVLGMLEPGVGEWQVEATLEHRFRMQGATGVSFGTICAGGAHAATLHYEANRSLLRDGDLILIDAGAEVGGYAGDISRTFPVNGHFSDAQRDIYELVLRAQKAGIAECVPGKNMKSPHQKVREIFAQGLYDLGIIQENPEKILKEEMDFAFYFHGTSHYLGMDVHDVGLAYHRGNDRPAQLEPGVVLTVEPGLYFREDDVRVPEKYRGIGVRIEDDVLVTDRAPVVLTSDIVKEADDIEAAMRRES